MLCLHLLWQHHRVLLSRIKWSRKAPFLLHLSLMKLFILYHPASEFARLVEEYAHDFERTRGKAIELFSLESPEGAEQARLYDIVQYPALLACRDDGQLLSKWEGEQLPLMNEVAGYLNS